VLWHGLYPSRAGLAERLAHCRDLKREVGLLDNRVRPEFPDQLAALQNPPSPLHQQHQQVERFRGQGDRLVLTSEHARHWIEAKLAKLVDDSSIGHGRFYECCRL
jgi:hypothetical protein